MFCFSFSTYVHTFGDEVIYSVVKSVKLSCKSLKKKWVSSQNDLTHVVFIYKQFHMHHLTVLNKSADPSEESVSSPPQDVG